MRKKSLVEIQEIKNMRKEGMSIREISKKTGFSINTIRKYCVSNSVSNDLIQEEVNSNQENLESVSNNVSNDLIQEEIKNLKEELSELKNLVYQMCIKCVSNDLIQQKDGSEEKNLQGVSNDVSNNVSNNVSKDLIQELRSEIQKIASELVQLKEEVYQIKNQVQHIFSIENILYNNTSKREGDIYLKEEDKNIEYLKDDKNNLESLNKELILDEINKTLNYRERDIFLFWISLVGIENVNLEKDIPIIRQILALATPQQAKSVIFDKFFKVKEENRNLEYFLDIFKSLNLRGKIKSSTPKEKITFEKWLEENPEYDYRKIVPKSWNECSKEEKETKLKAFYFAFNKAKEDKRVIFSQEDWKKYESARKKFNEIFKGGAR